MAQIQDGLVSVTTDSNVVDAAAGAYGTQRDRGAPNYSNVWTDSNADNDGYSDSIAGTHG